MKQKELLLNVSTWIIAKPTVHFTLHVPNQRVSSILSVQRAYSTQSKKKQLGDIFDYVPNSKAMLVWIIANDLKQNLFVVVSIKKPTGQPVILSMFFNPFQFKQRHRRRILLILPLSLC